MFGTRAVEKKALHLEIGIPDDLENNTPLKIAMRTRLKESGDDLKEKAEERISTLMKGSG